MRHPPPIILFLEAFFTWYQQSSAAPKNPIFRGIFHRYQMRDQQAPSCGHDGISLRAAPWVGSQFAKLGFEMWLVLVGIQWLGHELQLGTSRPCGGVTHGSRDRRNSPEHGPGSVSRLGGGRQRLWSTNWRRLRVGSPWLGPLLYHNRLGYCLSHPTDGARGFFISLIL